MSRKRMRNDEWIFGSNCFVCETTNEAGLRIPFWFDDETGEVDGEFVLDDRFSGAPSYLHGGVTLAILDEAQAWATIAAAHKFAVTTETTTRFLRPVLVGRDHTVTARLTGTSETHLETSAEVRNAEGKVCAESTATFAILSEAQARAATGVDHLGEHGEFLRNV